MVVPPRTPTCRVAGIIVGVDLEEESVRKDWRDEGVPNPPGWVPGTTSPARYRLRVLVREVAYVAGDDGEETCEGRYVPDREDIFSIYRTEVRADDSFRKGQSIAGEVWNGHFRSYTLKEGG